MSIGGGGSRPPFDPRLYLVTDPDLAAGRDLVQLVLAAVRGGVTLVQFRDKQASDAEFERLAGRLVRELTPFGVPLIVNDRVEAALAAGATGVHVGQSDMPAREARILLGEGRLLGLSIERLGDLEAAPIAALDYLAASPVFATPTKTDTAAPLGLSGVAAIATAVGPLPVLGIGGIGAGQIAGLIEYGASGAAVVSAILASDDVEAAARQLRRAVDEALARASSSSAVARAP